MCAHCYAIDWGEFRPRERSQDVSETLLRGYFCYLKVFTGKKRFKPFTHAGGGNAKLVRSDHRRRRFYPCGWGECYNGGIRMIKDELLPTQVGGMLNASSRFLEVGTFTHASGGNAVKEKPYSYGKQFYLCEWGECAVMALTFTHASGGNADLL